MLMAPGLKHEQEMQQEDVGAEKEMVPATCVPKAAMDEVHEIFAAADLRYTRVGTDPALEV